MTRNEARGSSRDCLEDARKILTAYAGPEPEKSELLANCCEALGDVRMDLKTYQAAQSRLTDALQLYAKIENSAGVGRVMTLFERLKQEYPDADCPVAISVAISRSSTSDSLGEIYEKLGVALSISNEPQARPKAIKAFYASLSHYGGDTPLPEAAIARVRGLIKKLS